MTVLMWLVLLLILVLGVGAIGSWFMRENKSKIQGLPHQEQIWLFRVSGCFGGLGGLIFGYDWGYQRPVNCGFEIIGCGLKAFFNGIGGSILGACFGATFGVIGTAVLLWLLGLFQQR